MAIGRRGILAEMSHTIRKKKKLALRVARIRGQVEALARALEGEAECGDVLRLIASARGALVCARAGASVASTARHTQAEARRMVRGITGFIGTV